MTTGTAARKAAQVPDVTRMEQMLLDRDEAPLADIVSREIVELGVRGPFLDVGAGTGVWVAMVERGGEVACGIDVLHSVLSAGREQYGLKALVLGDGSTLPFRDETFHWIQLREVIEHVDYARAARLLSEARRVLAPEGTLRLTTPNRLKYGAPSRRVRASWSGLMGRPDDPAHVHEYWPWELRRQVRDAGFRIDSFRYRARNPQAPLPCLSAGIDILATRAR